jgi:hypothetical protein
MLSVRPTVRNLEPWPRSPGVRFPLLRKYAFAFLIITWVSTIRMEQVRAPSKGLCTRNVFCVGFIVICAWGLILNPTKVPNFQYTAWLCFMNQNFHSDGFRLPGNLLQTKKWLPISVATRNFLFISLFRFYCCQSIVILNLWRNYIKNNIQFAYQPQKKKIPSMLVWMMQKHKLYCNIVRKLLFNHLMSQLFCYNNLLFAHFCCLLSFVGRKWKLIFCWNECSLWKL